MSVALEHEVPAYRRIEEILESEIGEVSAVDNPATARPFSFFKNAGGAGRGVVGMRKDGDLSAPSGDVATMEPPDEGMLVAGTVEIPAAPKKFGYSELIQAAMDLGFAEAEATAIAQLIRKDFGNPEDAGELLIPDGSSPEGMIAAAAVHGGLGLPQGMEQHQPEGEAVPKGLKFTSKPGDETAKAPFGAYWRRLTRRFLGLDRPKTDHEKLVEEVRELKTVAKSNQQLMEVIRILAHQLGVPPGEAAAVMAGEEEEAVVPAAVGGLASAGRAAAGVPGKCAVPAPVAPVPAPEKKSAEDVLAGISRVLAEAGWSASGAKVEATQPVAAAAPVGEPAVPAAPAVEEPLEFDPDSAGERVIDPATAPDYSGITATPPVAEKILPAARKALAPVAGAPANGNGKRFSTTLGIWVSAEDRRTAGWKNGV